jgi:tetratricopeptide (TPR) repeat protein
MELYMKAEHRHELKTNALADWMTHFPDWVRENLISIIIVAATILALGGFFFWKGHTKNTGLQEQYRFTSIVNQLSNSKMQILDPSGQETDKSSILFGPAGSLEAFANSTDDNNLAALAFIKHAEALRSELHYRTKSLSKEDLTAQIDRAKQSYVKAMEKSTDNASLAAAANFGLGLCEEELGNFDAARKIYGDIAENAAFQGTVSVNQAKLRLDTMADYQANVVFAPKPRPIQIKPSAIEMKPADPNKPGAAIQPTVPYGPRAVDAKAKTPVVIKQPIIEPNAAATKPEVKVVPVKPEIEIKTPAVVISPQDSNNTPKATDPNVSSR